MWSSGCQRARNSILTSRVTAITAATASATSNFSRWMWTKPSIRQVSLEFPEVGDESKNGSAFPGPARPADMANIYHRATARAHPGDSEPRPNAQSTDRGYSPAFLEE